MEICQHKNNYGILWTDLFIQFIISESLIFPLTGVIVVSYDTACETQPE
jgi:hypothetical protein